MIEREQIQMDVVFVGAGPANLAAALHLKNKVAEHDELIEKGLPLEFGHSLTGLLGGQCDAGFVITDLYEDYMLDSPLHKYHPNYIATRALKR